MTSVLLVVVQVIEYLAPRTDRDVQTGRASWLVSFTLYDLFADLFRRVPPAEDPYLAALSPAQIGYVEGGLQLLRADVLRNADRVAESERLLRDLTLE